MLKKIAMALVFFAIMLKGWQRFHEQPLGRFCPTNGPCFTYDSHRQGDLLIAYLSPQHQSSFLSWVQYWQSQQRFGAVLILSYEGYPLDSWEQAIEEQNLLQTYCLGHWDSSPYGLYPMAKSPGLYVLSENTVLKGPVDRFDQV